MSINEKGYLNPSFYRTYSNNTVIADELYGSVSLQDSLINHFEYKLEHLLKWEDRNSMWYSLEARVPFLDHRLVEKTLSTKTELIIKKGMTKHILRDAMKDSIPEKIRMRKDKVGFGTPQEEWFKTELFEKLISNTINSKTFKERGIINSLKASALYERHLSNEIDISKEIWKWLNLELWFRNFID